MHDDTGIGGPLGRYPTTMWSAVRGAASGDPAERARSFEALVAAYWKPVYKTIRIQWRKTNEEAKDLTQGFFARAMEKDFFAPYDPGRTRFRTFLRTCLTGYLSNEHAAARALKRGGGIEPLSLDFETADGELAAQQEPAAPDDLDRTFDREWARSLFERGVARLRADLRAAGRERDLELFERYDLAESRTTYQALAEALGMKPTDVTNHLAAVRRIFRACLYDELRVLTASEEEFREEAAALFGVVPGRR